MATKHTGKEPIRITADPGKTVVLYPENDDLFVRSGRQVIDACRLGISLDLWLTEIRAMIARIGEWAQSHAPSVRACYCAFRGNRTAVFFVPTSGQFEFDLADELADLNTELVKNFNVGMVEVHQIPMGELDRFVNRDSARQVYGEQPGSLPAVGT